MNVIFTAVITVAVLAAVPTEGLTKPTTLPTPVLVSGCTYHGQSYHVGENFQPSPCEHCYCTGSGHPACAIADCFFTQCVDAVHDPKQCCPTCPNGPNCRAPDGHIIKQGETYHPDANTMCSCNQDHFMFGNGLDAMCAHTAVLMHPTTAIVN